MKKEENNLVRLYEKFVWNTLVKFSVQILWIFMKICTKLDVVLVA